LAKRAIASAAVLAGPLVVSTIYLVVSRWPSRWFTATSDYAALGISVALGGAALFFVFSRPWQRWVGLAIYVPVAAVLLAVYGLFFVCGVFGDCL